MNFSTTAWLADMPADERPGASPWPEYAESVPIRPEGPSGPRAGMVRRGLAVIIDLIFVGAPTYFGLEFDRTFGIMAMAILGTYELLREASETGQTIGKWIMRIRVISLETGGPIDFKIAVIRNLVRVISLAACFGGFLAMYLDPERQTWHDRVVNTVVVPLSAYPVDTWAG